MGARRRRGGVPEMGFRAGSFVLCKDGYATKGAGTQNLARKIFFREKMFPHICVVKIISTTSGSFPAMYVGVGPPPPPGTAGRAAPAQTPHPARRPRRGRGDWANGLPCHPPPRKAIFFPPYLGPGHIVDTSALWGGPPLGGARHQPSLPCRTCCCGFFCAEPRCCLAHACGRAASSAFALDLPTTSLFGTPTAYRSGWAMIMIATSFAISSSIAMGLVYSSVRTTSVCRWAHIVQTRAQVPCTPEPLTCSPPPSGSTGTSP